MSSTQTIYTYRGGEKVSLIKHPSQFVARALPLQLTDKGFPVKEQLSSASTLIDCKPEELEPMMKALRLTIVCHHLYAVKGENRQFLITDRLFLKFKESCDAIEMANLVEAKNLIIVKEYSDRYFLVELTDKTDKNPIKLVVDLVENHSDLLVEVDHDLNYITYSTALQLPTDSSYKAQWHLQKSNLPDVDPRSSSNCEEAWKVLNNFGSHDVVIGITDDGCDMRHQDFGATNKFAHWAYFDGIKLIKKNDRGANINKMYQSGINHGTACAGVAAAQVNGRMSVGAAPNCKVLPIKWETGSDGRMFVSDAKIVEIIDYVSDKVDVLTSSWSDAPINTRSVQVTNAISKYAEKGGRRDKGIVFLWSAGNNNCPIHHTSDIEIPFSAGLFWYQGNAYWVIKKNKKFFNSFTYLPGVMIVGAISSLAKRSHYSNYGIGLSVCAPSSNQHTYGRMQLRGRPITTTLGGNTVRSDFGGTSSATPLTAGIAALVISANRHLTALEVIQILKRTASKDLNMEGYPKTPFDPQWDVNERDWDISPVFPFDSGNFQNLDHPDGTWSPWFGYGKVDALAAVKQAIKQLPEPRDTTPTSGPGIFLFRPFHVSGIAHFSSSGDRTIRGGLALPTGRPNQKLTGISLNLVEQAEMEVWYQITMDDGSQSSWVQEGTFVGNRTGTPCVQAIAMRLQGGPSDRFSISYRVVSRSSGISAACIDGQACAVATGDAIRAFTVSIRRKR